MPDALLSTKFYIPPVRADAVSRPRLVEKLLAGVNRPGSLTLLSGPAGFGKTTLLSELAAQLRRPAAWVSLDEGENDPIRFWTYLIAACQSVQAGVGAAALALFRAPQPLPNDTVPTILINDLARLAGGLCETVAGGQDGQAMLAALHRANLFLIPLDNEGRWFRYHHLLADLLQARLRQSLPADALARLHGRAAAWYADNGFAVAAISHALAARDFAGAARLMEQAAEAVLIRGELATLQQAKAVKAAHPVLLNLWQWAKATPPAPSSPSASRNLRASECRW